MRYFIRSILFIFLMLMWGCTNLNEQVYSTITGSNFLQTHQNVIQDFIRSFEHCYWSIAGNETYEMEEDCADQLMTPTRGGDWYNGGEFARLHYHTWTANDNFTSDAWNAFYEGICLATNSMQDLQGIRNNTQKLAQVDFTQAQIDEMIAELRVMRAWMYIRALDFYRNIVLVPSVQGVSQGEPQVSPQVAFAYIESELKEAIPNLYTNDQLGDNAIGRWTKGGAAALLVRLYLNSKVWTGVDRFDSCAQVCQDIIDGKYGTYALDSTWYGPFDYTNSTSKEVIFGFPGSYGLSHWQYGSDMYWWMLPYQAPRYFGFTDWGDANPKYSLQPGRDVDSVEYSFALGKPFMKFQKYPDDYRLQLYKNLGGSKRQGMFLYGYLTYTDSNGQLDTIKGDGGPYPLYIRDQSGWFLGAKPGTKIADKESDMLHADDNSGIYPVKYPFYPSSDPNKISSAYAEIRLAEIYYSLAECKYRAGDKAGAAVLLNDVRKRDYPSGSPSLYKPDGSQLTDQEMIDEWGREFLVEGRRRTDLIRWGVFNSGTWWDKQPDPDNHTDIYPIGESVLNASRQLKQNPGY
ncbi:hypothetical protein FHX64_000701 [Microbacter margulisiae]|uniref:RagB/SusD domain-containing protein n=2 Tax=Microbacter margulisiae TaxID=1350067 RepID=A0A7W5DQQ2_9PORP|nr:hypothetical protein [Microbacter margulisiae]